MPQQHRHIYLDSKDLIDVLERGRPISQNQLLQALVSGGDSIVVSQVLIGEISSPLLHKNARTNVMRMLGQLETLPLSFIQHGSIVPQEIHAAIAAYGQKEKVQPVDPYVARFDEALTLGDPPVTRHFIAPSIAEMVFMIFADAPETLRIRELHVASLRKLLNADRQVPNEPPPSTIFRGKMLRTLRQNQIPITHDIRDFADWVFEDPSRCPYLRLGFELYHAIRRNIGDRVEDSTLADILHANLLPYVDLQTLDRRMRAYVRQADRRMGTAYAKKVQASVGDILRIDVP